VASLWVAASTPVAAATCPAGGRETLVVDLMFGRNIGAHLGVSERAFRNFIDIEVTSRFPDGFTLLDTVGQYRSPGSRSIVKEPGKQLTIALSDEGRDLPRIREIVEAYKSQFKQQSVAIIANRSCIAF
jgi:hypothetical protein